MRMIVWTGQVYNWLEAQRLMFSSPTCACVEEWYWYGVMRMGVAQNVECRHRRVIYASSLG